MGIDVEMMARSAEPLSDEDVLSLAADFAATFGSSDLDYPVLKRATHDDHDGRIVRIDTLDRYYGTYYSRGHWPTIRAMGDWLMVRFGETGEVRYGGDISSGWEEIAPYPLLRQECEAHWTSHGHAPYLKDCRCDHCLAL